MRPRVPSGPTTRSPSAPPAEWPTASTGRFAGMCGRFVSASPPDQIASYFDAEEPEAVLPPSYNVAPTKDVYAVLSDGGVRHVDAFHWRSEEHTSELQSLMRIS